MRKSLLFLSLVCLSFWFSSCVTPGQLKYFQDLKGQIDSTKTTESDSEINTIIIQPYDLLDIRITTTTKALELLTQSQTSGSFVTGTGQNNSLSTYIQSFLVDQSGNIILPLVGNVYVKGLSIAQARSKIAGVMKVYLNDPYVELKFLTFRVTILGEIIHPGVVTVSNEKANLIDVLALAGDMTDYGNRTNVKIIRGDPRNPKVYLVDMTNTKTYNSAGFILQPNDIIYVEAYNRKYILSNLNLILPYLSIINTLFIIVNIILALRPR